MTFFEFLDALGEGRYRSVVEEHAVLAPFPRRFTMHCSTCCAPTTS